jgi:excisionase family DNA binding protein
MESTTTWRDRTTITVPEAAEILGVSRSTIYRAIKAGTFPVVQIGSRVVIPTAALARLLDPVA